MAQLRKPGGLMPSFADKLTDKEKADLAAFVGAGKASGKPVVAPFAPDDKRVADCRDGDTECFEQSFGNLVFSDGPKPALDRLQQMMGTNTTVASDCHRITHRMGSAALKRFKDERRRGVHRGLARSAGRATTTGSSSARSSASPTTSSRSSRASSAATRRSTSSASSPTSASTASATA